MISKEIERKGVTKILNYLNQNDLKDLVLTVTNRMLNSFKEEETVQLILNYSKDSLNFLKKKKVKKEFIFRYLNDEKVYVNSFLSKSDLIRECLKYWGSDDSCESMDVESDDSNQEYIVIEPDVVKSEPKDQLNQVSIYHDCSTNNEPQFSNQINYQTPINDQESTNLLNLLNNQQSFNLMISQQLTKLMNTQQSFLLNLNNNQTSPNYQNEVQIIELSLKFGEWFYSELPLINNGNFDVNNFWPDSQLRITFEYHTQRVSLDQSGNQQNVNLLKDLVLCKLGFKPNLLPQFDGVRANMHEYGVLKTLILGVLYYENEPVGFFDSRFGLIADPNLYEHNWRIKCLEIIIKLSKPIQSVEDLINSFKSLNQIKN